MAWMGEHDQGRGDEGNGTSERRNAASVADPRRPVPDRVLDEPERRGGEQRRHGDPHDRERRAVEPGALGRQRDVHRPVPQVQPVRADADPHQRSQRKSVRDTTVRQRHQGGDDGSCDDGMEEQAAAVERRRAGAVEHEPRCADPDRERGDHQISPATESGDGPPRHLPGGRRRHRRPDEDRSGPGVGAHVDPCRVRTGLVQDEHRDERRDDTTERDDKEVALPVSPLAHLPHREHDEWPRDIELLLDGEAPEMVEHRRLVERRPVAVGLADEVPVGHVGERPAAGATDAVEVGWCPEHPRTEGDDGDQHEHCWKQPPEPPPPERQQSDAAAFGVTQQQRRDQEARQGEEQVDAEETALQMAGVEQEHGDDRGGAQTIERGQVLPCEA